MSERRGVLIRPIAFFRKDVVEVLRQPRLLLTLVLGPFLILLIFGVGFSPEPQTVRTVLVVPEGNFEAESEQFADRISERLDVVETTTDEARGREILAAGEADLVVVIPERAAAQIRQNQHAAITIYHDQIDPFEKSFIQIFASASVDEVNQEMFRQLIQIAQTEAAELDQPMLSLFEDISPEVLVSPFVATVENLHGVDVDFSHFYVPGVVALLLQHMALTFAALSLVRERSLGAVELFRVSPLSGGEVLIGKYLAYTTLGLVVGGALTVAAVYGFGFQVAGSWWWFVAINLLVLLAAQGAGFVVSAVARTESEAVQYAMIMLLVAIFFSGFFISLDRLLAPVRVISYLIPATYGMVGMQEIAFRGLAPSPLILGGVTVLALVFLVTAWMLIRTRVVAGINPKRASQ